MKKATGRGEVDDLLDLNRMNRQRGETPFQKPRGKFMEWRKRDTDSAEAVEFGQKPFFGRFRHIVEVQIRRDSIVYLVEQIEIRKDFCFNYLQPTT